MQRFVRSLLHGEMTRNNYKAITTALRKLDWKDMKVIVSYIFIALNPFLV